MSPDDKAAKVAEIAKQLAYRQRYQIAHSGHTVHRFLEAVSELLGRPVHVLEAPQLGNGRSHVGYDG